MLTIKRLYTQFLIWLGYRSPCCAAPVFYDPGYGKSYCSICELKV